MVFVRRLKKKQKYDYLVAAVRKNETKGNSYSGLWFEEIKGRIGYYGTEHSEISFSISNCLFSVEI